MGARTNRPPCGHCAGPTIPGATRYGYCDTCYTRWRRAGRPADGPPPVGTTQTQREAARLAVRLAHQACRDKAAARREDYADLREAGLDRWEAAARVGVSMETARRYEKHLQKEGQLT